MTADVGSVPIKGNCDKGRRLANQVRSPRGGAKRERQRCSQTECAYARNVDTFAAAVCDVMQLRRIRNWKAWPLGELRSPCHLPGI